MEEVEVDYINHPAIPLDSKLVFLLRYIKPYYLTSKLGIKTLQNIQKTINNVKEIKKVQEK